MNRAAPAARRLRAVESFTSAADCLGPIGPETAVFAITRGQFSMIDAVRHVLDQLGPAAVSLWTWTVAEYEVQVLETLRDDRRILSGVLVIDAGARAKNAPIIAAWKRAHGPQSVRYVHNHAKIATVDNGTVRCLIRGSMNLNFNPRFEQIDLTCNGPDFDLIRGIESELPVLDDRATGDEVWTATKAAPLFGPWQQQPLKRWAK